MLLGNNPYPQDVRVRREALALVGAGYRVTVIAPRMSGQPRRERIDGVDVIRYPSPIDAHGFVGHVAEHAVAAVAAFALASRTAVSPGFDVLHAHNPPDTFAVVGKLFKLFGKRFVYDHHDLSPEMYDARFGERANPLVRRLLVFLERLSCRAADHVIATNESYRAMEIERSGVPAESVTVVRNGPDPAQDFAVAPDGELRAKAGTILGYVGNMGRQDGVDHLLRAVRHLVYDLGIDDVYCVVVGKGDARAGLIELAAELGVSEKVWFTGFIPRPDLRRYLSTADVCVDPDPSNAFNDRSTMIKMLEYMALGKPIVAFDLPEHRVTADGAALYARPNDDLDLARKIAELARDPTRARQMGTLGRKRVESALAWEYSVPRLLDAYRRVSPTPLHA